jgi:signal transduction histidine kinase
MGDLRLMAYFLSFTALASFLLSFAGYRLRWMHRSASVRWTLLGGYALSSGLTFLNVWLTARLMFASQHDLQLATILLLFAGGIAMAFGYFFSGALTDRIRIMDHAAREIAAGNLQTSIPVEGRDEISELSQAFNEMTTRLQEAADRQKETETLRRDLIAWVSHDLQTPLASIRLILEALADGVVEEPETVERYLRTAQREIGALSRLIDDLFQMAQLDAGGLVLERSLNSFSDLVSDTLESFSTLANRQQVHLEGSVASGLDSVWMDAEKIGRVLNNLVGNALRHTSAGGSVNVRVTSCPEGVLTEVVDTGEGIQPEDLPWVFDRFYRSEKSRSRETGGAGLGLAIARGIIDAHGGRIWAESEPGISTRFAFTLPTKKPDS